MSLADFQRMPPPPCRACRACDVCTRFWVDPKRCVDTRCTDDHFCNIVGTEEQLAVHRASCPLPHLVVPSDAMWWDHTYAMPACAFQGRCRNDACARAHVQIPGWPASDRLAGAVEAREEPMDHRSVALWAWCQELSKAAAVHAWRVDDAMPPPSPVSFSTWKTASDVGDGEL